MAVDWGAVGGFSGACGLLITLTGLLWATVKNWRSNAVNMAEKRITAEHKQKRLFERVDKLEDKTDNHERRIVVLERRRIRN